jgi:TolA-binding protein
LLKSFPDSIHGPEARFLLVEGYFQSNDYEACIEVVEQMIRLYPESELTGFSLLRLAKIYERRDRIEDAAEIYRSISQNFTQAELKRQAELSLRAVDI